MRRRSQAAGSKGVLCPTRRKGISKSPAGEYRQSGLDHQVEPCCRRPPVRRVGPDDLRLAPFCRGAGPTTYAGDTGRMRADRLRADLETNCRRERRLAARTRRTSTRAVDRSNGFEMNRVTASPGSPRRRVRAQLCAPVAGTTMPERASERLAQPPRWLCDPSRMTVTRLRCTLGHNPTEAIR